MHKTKDELYELVKDIKTKKEFEKEIKDRYEKNGELFDKDTIALLIIDDLGKNNNVISKISDLKPDLNCSVIGNVINIYDSKTFTRKNGTSGRVANLDISDETGSCRLVLWDNDVEQIKNKEIKKGTKIKIINGYTKNGYSGLEINLGRWGLLEIESYDNSIEKEISTDEIKGVLVEKQPTRAFFKDNGDFGFVSTIKIKDDKHEKCITIWDDKVKEIQEYKIGDKIQIKNITIKQNNGKTEIHANGNCIIKSF